MLPIFCSHIHIVQYRLNRGSWTAPALATHLCITHACIHIHIAKYKVIRGSETAPALVTHLCITHVSIHIHIGQYRLIRGSETAPALATHLCITHVCIHVHIILYRLIRRSETAPRAPWASSQYLVYALRMANMLSSFSSGVPHLKCKPPLKVYWPDYASNLYTPNHIHKLVWPPRPISDLLGFPCFPTMVFRQVRSRLLLFPTGWHQALVASWQPIQGNFIHVLAMG